MSNHNAAPSPVGSGAVGPRAAALLAAINRIGIKCSDADRLVRTTATANDTTILFPAVFSGMTGVVLSVIDCMSLLSGMSPDFSAAEQNQIYDAFKGFVQLHRQFVATVVGMPVNVTYSQQCTGISSCFLAGKMYMSSFVNSIISLVPARVDDAKSQQESLERTLVQATGFFFQPWATRS